MPRECGLAFYRVIPFYRVIASASEAIQKSSHIEGLD
jgi:hypothetical protein